MKPGAESGLAPAYLPPSYVFSHSADSCSTQARASAFLVNPSICVSRPCGGVTRTDQPFPLFDRTGSNLAFGAGTGIVKLCDVLHRNTRTKFLRLIKATGAQIRAMPNAKHGSTRMGPMDLLADSEDLSPTPSDRRQRLKPAVRSPSRQRESRRSISLPSRLAFLRVCWVDMEMGKTPAQPKRRDAPPRDSSRRLRGSSAIQSAE